MVKNHVINCTFPKFPVVSYILGLHGKMKLTEWVTYWKRIRRKHIFYGNVIIIYAKKILTKQFWMIWDQKSSCWEKDKCRRALFPKNSSELLVESLDIIIIQDHLGLQISWSRWQSCGERERAKCPACVSGWKWLQARRRWWFSLLCSPWRRVMINMQVINITWYLKRIFFGISLSLRIFTLIP